MTLLSLRPCLHLCCFILKQSWDKSPLSLYFIYTLYLDGRQESKAFRCCLYSDESQHSRRTIHQCLIGISKFSQIKQIILLQNPNTHHTVPLLPHSISYHCMSISSNQKLCPNLILVIASLFTSISSAGAISCSSNIYSNLSMSLDFLYNSSHCHLSPILCLQTFFFFSFLQTTLFTIQPKEVFQNVNRLQFSPISYFQCVSIVPQIKSKLLS